MDMSFLNLENAARTLFNINGTLSDVKYKQLLTGMEILNQLGFNQVNEVLKSSHRQSNYEYFVGKVVICRDFQVRTVSHLIKVASLWNSQEFTAVLVFSNGEATEYCQSKGILNDLKILGEFDPHNTKYIKPIGEEVHVKDSSEVQLETFD